MKLIPDWNGPEPMNTAPRDGTFVRLYLRGGVDFEGYYSSRWFGWVERKVTPVVVRGDNQFVGWEPLRTKESET